MVRISSLYFGGMLKCSFSSGKEKNFVYSHLHPAGRVYEAHPKLLELVLEDLSGRREFFWTKILRL